MLRNIKNHLKLLFCKERELYVFYYKFLGFYPYDISYYNEAFTHRSSSVKSKNGTDINNERLEFLGDAILDAIVADILFKQFPNKKEGFLTSTRAKIVQRENLNKIGLSLQLDKIIKTAIHSKSHNSYMYGNAVEALIGAIYLDKGYKVCKTFIIKNVIGDNLNKVANEELNYKSKLIEWSQKSKVSISFELISTTTDEQH
ncbi:MAG: ribonuclease III domain-containing protein, partial [Muribaculaceae bacterium]